MYLIDGPVLLAEALASQVEIETLYVEPEALNHESVWAARASEIAVREVTRGALKKVLDLGTPQDMVAVARQSGATLDGAIGAALASERPLLVLVELQDPGNAGTLIRVAEASGCAGVVLTERTVDLYNPKTVRATAGALFRVLAVTDVGIDEVLTSCEGAGLATWATVVLDGAAAENAPLSGAGALLVGSEAHGLDAGVVQRCQVPLTIPMEGEVESLNAAVAGAVVLFEASRQRRAVEPRTAEASS